MKVLVDLRVRFEHVQVFGCDIKPGSVERSTDLNTKGIPQPSAVARAF
jgi:hypothetical protein